VGGGRGRDAATRRVRWNSFRQRRRIRDPNPPSGDLIHKFKIAIATRNLREKFLPTVSRYLGSAHALNIFWVLAYNAGTQPTSDIRYSLRQGGGASAVRAR